MKPTWTDKNRLRLLENGEAFFPRVFEVIAAARHEVIVETFILFDDPVGRGLHKALLSAAENGATVHLVVDGYGSPDLPIEFIRSLTEAGVHFHSWDPQPTLLGIRTNLFRRLHRKIVVVDEQRAFVGGINYAEDHLRRAGPQSKQDFAVELQGPVVEQIRGYCLEQLGRDPRSTPMSVLRRWTDWPRRLLARRRRADAQVLFCVRDNDHHPRAIEEQYRQAIRAARCRVERQYLHRGIVGRKPSHQPVRVGLGRPDLFGRGGDEAFRPVGAPAVDHPMKSLYSFSSI
mgnify:CR=1 FL=1